MSQRHRQPSRPATLEATYEPSSLGALLMLLVGWWWGMASWWLPNPFSAWISDGRVNPVGQLSGLAPFLELPSGVSTKPGVVLRGLDRRMWPVLRTAAAVWLGHGRALVITSGLDGKHHKGSRHYVGLALDLRSRDMGAVERSLIARELRESLGDGCQVLVERDHIHVEHDPASLGDSRLARADRPRRRATGRETAELAEGVP